MWSVVKGYNAQFYYLYTEQRACSKKIKKRNPTFFGVRK